MTDDTDYDPQTGKYRDRESGQFVSEHDAEDFIVAIKQIKSEDEFPTTRRVSDEVDMTRRGALKNLKKLEQQGVLSSQQVAGSKVWHVVE